MSVSYNCKPSVTLLVNRSKKRHFYLIMKDQYKESGSSCVPIYYTTMTNGICNNAEKVLLQ